LLNEVNFQVVLIGEDSIFVGKRTENGALSAFWQLHLTLQVNKIRTVEFVFFFVEELKGLNANF